MRRYLLGSGYYEHVNHPEAREFARYRVANILRSARPKPTCAVIIAVGGVVPHSSVFETTSIVSLSGNLGYIHDLIGDTPAKDNALCGWSASVLALALLAYNDEADLVYQEQDCLAFGPYIEQMYADLGDGGIVFGRAMVNEPRMPAAQGLFLIKHTFLLEFVSRYIALGSDREGSFPEQKFTQLGPMSRRLSFGYDRERPLNMDDPVWYGQQFTENEMVELKRRGLI